VRKRRGDDSASAREVPEIGQHMLLLKSCGHGSNCRCWSATG